MARLLLSREQERELYFLFKKTSQGSEADPYYAFSYYSSFTKYMSFVEDHFRVSFVGITKLWCEEQADYNEHYVFEGHEKDLLKLKMAV